MASDFRLIDPEDVDALIGEYGKYTTPELMKQLHQLRLRQDYLCQLEHKSLYLREYMEDLYCKTKILVENQLATTPKNKENEGWRRACIATQDLTQYLKDELFRLKKESESNADKKD